MVDRWTKTVISENDTSMPDPKEVWRIRTACINAQSTEAKASIEWEKITKFSKKMQQQPGKDIRDFPNHIQIL